MISVSENNPLNAFRTRNETAKERLRELIYGGEAFTLIGAGSSKCLDFPLWDEFLTNFYDEVLKNDERASIQQYYSEHLPESLDIEKAFTVRSIARKDPLGLASQLEAATKARSPNALRNYLNGTFTRPAALSPLHEPVTMKLMTSLHDIYLRTPDKDFPKDPVKVALSKYDLPLLGQSIVEQAHQLRCRFPFPPTSEVFPQTQCFDSEIPPRFGGT